MKKFLSLTIIGALAILASMASIAQAVDFAAFELTPYVADFDRATTADTNIDFAADDNRTPESRRAIMRISKPVSTVEIDHRFMHRLHYVGRWQKKIE